MGWRHLAYVILVALSYGMAHFWEVYTPDVCRGHRGTNTEAVASAGLYQSLAKAGRDPRMRFVRLVTFRRGKEPDELFDNICRQRLFMAKLIRKLSDSNASVIVLDKYFLPTSCLDSSVNSQLISAIQQSTSPIVIGRATYNEDDLERDHPLTAQERDNFQGSCLVLAPSIDLDPLNRQAISPVKSGLIRANVDNRRIPITWNVFRSRADLIGGKAESLPTLPVVAAEVFDPAVADRLVSTVPKDKHPYTSFLFQREFLQISALDLVCNGQANVTKWEDCTSGNLGSSDIRARIVVVGDATNDIQETVVGEVPGMVLQANYIESLLDDRYLKPIPAGIETLITILWIVFIEIIFERMNVLLALFSALAITGLLWIACREVVIQTHYLPLIYFPTVLALLIKTVDCFRSKLRERSNHV